MKKVVLFSAFATPFRSGAEACAEEVTAQLQNRYDITLITARLRRDLPMHDVLASGVRIVRVGIGYPIDKWLYPLLAPLQARRIQPDIVHAILESYAGLALLCAAVILPSAKRILTCQSTNTRLLLRPMHRAAHRVTAISRVLIERARTFGVEAVHIPNGIRLHDLQSACKRYKKEEGRILYLGRLEPMKGVETVLDAFAQIADSYPQAILVVAGEGSLRPSLEKRQASLVSAGRIRFCGYLSVEDAAAEFAKAQIFCGLSRSEALGNVFLEAQAAGCAVVATDVGGIPDIVQDGESGILVQPDQPKQAAEALMHLLQDQSERSRLAESGKKSAEGYDWGHITERYASLYDLG